MLTTGQIVAGYYFMFPAMWIYGFPQIPPALMFDFLTADHWDGIIVEFATLFSVAGSSSSEQTDPVALLNAQGILAVLSKLEKYEDREAAWSAMTAGLHDQKGGAKGARSKEDLLDSLFVKKQRGGGGGAMNPNTALTAPGGAMNPNTALTAPGATGTVPAATFATLAGAAGSGAIAIAQAAANSELTPSQMLEVAVQAQRGLEIQGRLADIENRSRIIVQTMSGNFTAAKVGEEIARIRATLQADVDAVRAVVNKLAAPNFKPENVNASTYLTPASIRSKLSKNGGAIVDALMNAKGRMLSITTAFNEERRRGEQQIQSAYDTTMNHLYFLVSSAGLIIAAYHSNAMVAGYAADDGTVPIEGANATATIIQTATAAAATAAATALGAAGAAAAAAPAGGWGSWLVTGARAVVRTPFQAASWAVSATVTEVAKGVETGVYYGIVGEGAPAAPPSITLYDRASSLFIPALTLASGASLMYVGSQGLTYWKLRSQISNITKVQYRFTTQIYQQLFLALLAEYQTAVEQSFDAIARLTVDDSSRMALFMAAEGAGGLPQFVDRISRSWVNLTSRRQKRDLVALLGDEAYRELMEQLIVLSRTSAETTQRAMDRFRRDFADTRESAVATVSAPLRIARDIVSAISTAAVGAASVVSSMANPVGAVVGRLAASATTSAPAPTSASASASAGAGPSDATLLAARPLAPGQEPVTQAQLTALLQAFAGAGRNPQGINPQSAGNRMWQLAGLPQPLQVRDMDDEGLGHNTLVPYRRGGYRRTKRAAKGRKARKTLHRR